MNSDGEFILSDAEFIRIKKRIYQIAGISLSDAKKTLVLSRLSKLLRKYGCSSFRDYLNYLDAGTNQASQDEFVNALTTNLTRFYREDHHFDHLCGYVGEIIAQDKPSPRGGRRLRIWSAGCSTGQEPYTIAMALMSAHPILKGWDFKILATDVDTDVVARAAAGVYPENELVDLSIERRRPFEKAGGGQVCVPQDLRSLIAFKPLNLINTWPFKGPFDAIFCRNVAIYFDKPTQRNLFERFEHILRPDGFLYIGHSENINVADSGFRSIGNTIYRNTAHRKKSVVA